MFGNFNNVHIETFGEGTTVPDDDVAKLMYYLSCVDTVINYNEIDILTDYQNYDLLTVDDMVQLFKLVLLFNPEIFIKAGIFILDENLLTFGMDNQFYQITDERIGININEILIGGRTVKVLKVMALNESWLIRNYYRPWKNIFELTEKYQRFSNPYYVPPPPEPLYMPPKRGYYGSASNYRYPREPIYNPPKINNNNFSSNYTPPSPVIVTRKKSKDSNCPCLIF